MCGIKEKSGIGVGGGEKKSHSIFLMSFKSSACSTSIQRISLKFKANWHGVPRHLLVLLLNSVGRFYFFFIYLFFSKQGEDSNNLR